MFEMRKASRRGITPLIVLYSESGCGKTFSSLLLARGLVGPFGNVAMIDSEGGRGELYADVDILGGYEYIRFDEPFTPARYIEAIAFAQQRGADVIIVDSGSHEWEGVGGVLDMAAEREKKSGRAGLHNWKTPKFEHAKFIQALTRLKVPVIICLRAKYKTRQLKVKGKTEIVKDSHTSPIQAEDFIFEATCHGEIMPDHKLLLTKWSHPKLKSCFPANGMITTETGELIADWCNAPASSGQSETPKETPAPEPQENTAQPEAPERTPVQEAKWQLWNSTKSIHLGEKRALSKWLQDKAILKDGETLDNLDDVERIEIIIELAGIAKAEQEGVL